MLDLLVFAIFYILPMTMIFYTNNRAIKVLWNIDSRIVWKDPKIVHDEHNTPTSTTYMFPSDGGGQGLTLNANKSSSMTASGFTMASGSSAAMANIRKQLVVRRKAAKMLIWMAALFAICYLPIHVLNITRLANRIWQEDNSQKTCSTFISLFCLLLKYYLADFQYNNNLI